MKILICPLDWGLGHVTRSIALAKTLENEQHSVSWAIPLHLKQLVVNHFPDAQVFELPAYNIHFSTRKTQVFSLLSQIPKILQTIKKEYVAVNQIQTKEKFDLIISDHRYGCYSTKTKSVFLSHQLQVLLPPALQIFQRVFNAIHKLFLRPFHEVWIPDFENRSLSGKLSKLETRASQRFIGPLSRFQYFWETASVTFPFDKFDCIGIASGPEPHRSMFVNQLFQLFQNKEGRHLIITGEVRMNEFKQLSPNVVSVSNLSTEDFRRLVLAAKEVHCRSGYSSVMDYHVLNIKPYYYPTPGQTEQEYLANLHANQIGK